MRFILLFSVCLLITFGFVDCILIYKSVSDTNTQLALFFTVLLIFPVFGVCYLTSFKNKLIKNKKKVHLKNLEEYTWLVTNKAEPYELWPSISLFVFNAFIFLVLGILPLLISIKMLSINTDNKDLMLLILVSFFGLFFAFITLFSILKLMGKPIIRIDTNGIQHYMIDLILWKDITDIFLHTVKLKSSTQYSLVLYIKSTEYYRNKDKSLFKSMIKGNKLSLILPVSSENAQIIETVAKAFAARMNAPMLDSKITGFLKSLDDAMAFGKNLEGNWNEDNANEWLYQTEQAFAKGEPIANELGQRLNKIAEESNKTSKTLGGLNVIMIFLLILYLVILMWKFKNH